MATGTLLTLGHGYSAAALGRLLLAEGWRVIGATRSADKAEALRAQGVEPLLWPGEDAGPALDAADHLLISAAPGPDGDPVLARLGDAIAARAGALRWVGYLSTTGIYGDHQGGWVDEDTPPNPAPGRSAARVEAEQAWRRLHAEAGAPVHVFRLAGIYGPGRGPFAKLREGTARRIIKPGQIFSRIHVDDIARVLRASIDRPNPGRVYNVCDDEPAPPQEVTEHAARLLGIDPPPEVDYETADLSPMARSFYADSKRVANRRLHDELGVRLAHPTYREGYGALLG